MADLLTTSQVQDRLKVDRTTIYRMIDAGHLPAIRVGKQWRFQAPDIERWLHAHAAATRAGDSQLPELAQTQPERSAGFRAGTDPGDLRTLLPLASAQEIQNGFAEALGVTLVTADMRGVPLTEISNACGFQAALMRDPTALQKCALVWRQLAASPSMEPKLYPNEMGLLCARGLIRSGSTLLGMVVIGGIAPDPWPPSHEGLAAIADLFGLERGFVESNAGAVYRLDRSAQERALRGAQRIADIFSHLVDDRATVVRRMRTIESLTQL
ncbi:MAG: helix-turn-helix domain-containing protein [Anaerolineae bacterium]|nr:helix-turn-helix domain-containing protein [Anaerolineae bacterium]